MKKMITLLLAAILAGAITGCASEGNRHLTDNETNALEGGAIGAAGGAVIGALAGAPAIGAAVGGAVGATTGALWKDINSQTKGSGTGKKNNK